MVPVGAKVRVRACGGGGLRLLTAPLTEALPGPRASESFWVGSSFLGLTSRMPASLICESQAELCRDLEVWLFPMGWLGVAISHSVRPAGTGIHHGVPGRTHPGKSTILRWELALFPPGPCLDLQKLVW